MKTKEQKEEFAKYFDSYEGIFENTKNPKGIQKLKDDFKSEQDRLSKNGLSIAFDFKPIEIEKLQSRIGVLRNESKDPLSHLGIFYGLSHEDTDTSMKLIFKGVHIDKDLEILLCDEPAGEYDMPLICHDASASAGQKSSYVKTFDGIHGKHNHIAGCYIRLEQGNYKHGKNTILSVLDVYQNEGCDLLDISFGFMKPDDKAPEGTDVGLTCFHMIFTGKKSDDPTFSASQIFSTFDNDSGYSGPKPACPPFCPKT